MKIKIFANKDSFFTRIIIKKIIAAFPVDTLFFIHYETLSFNRKLKSILVLFLFSPFFSFIKILIKKKNDSINYCNIDFNNYNFGIIINYPKLLKLEKYPLYNFHLGNLQNQRGSFIYFYKFLYNWKKIDLSFYKLTEEKFDIGILINSISINVSKKSALDILMLYENNNNFIKKSINKINTNHFYKNKNILKPKKINLSPSWFLILKTFLIKKIIRV